jgi:hypothetical protein
MECHYVVCMRCRAHDRQGLPALAGMSVCRNGTGGFVVRATRREGCRVCGMREVEVQWGIPPSDVGVGEPGGRPASSPGGGAPIRGTDGWRT